MRRRPRSCDTLTGSPLCLLPPLPCLCLTGQRNQQPLSLQTHVCLEQLQKDCAARPLQLWALILARGRGALLVLM